jgi:hypothetical protein
MEDDYTLDYLTKTFKNHYEKLDPKMKADCEKYGHEYFNISKALYVICTEIQKLKEK